MNLAPIKIVIAGTGYVGLSNAILLAQHNEVVALDIIAEKIDMLNRKQSPIEDAEIEGYLKNKNLNFRATLDKVDTYTGADYVIIATYLAMRVAYFNELDTLRRIAHIDATVPANTSWYLPDLGEFRGKQERYTRQNTAMTERPAFALEEKSAS